MWWGGLGRCDLVTGVILAYLFGPGLSQAGRRGRDCDEGSRGERDAAATLTMLERIRSQAFGWPGDT